MGRENHARAVRPGILLVFLIGVLARCGTSDAPPFAGRGSSVAETPHTKLPPWPASVDRIRYGVTPYAGPSAMRDTFDPVTRYLGDRLGVPVQLVVGESYAEIGRLLASQELDVASISPLAYVLAKERDLGIEILGVQLTEGAPSYVGYVVVRAWDPADRLEDLEGRSICYVDTESASGYLYPRAIMRRRGLDPDRVFSFVTFAGDHLACIRQVLEDQVDAAATYSGALATAERRGIDVRSLRIIAKTPAIPDEAHCARSGLPRAAVVRIRHELLSLSNLSADGRTVLRRPIRMSAWTRGEDAQYDGVRKILAETIEAESRAF